MKSTTITTTKRTRMRRMNLPPTNPELCTGGSYTVIESSAKK